MTKPKNELCIWALHGASTRYKPSIDVSLLSIRGAPLLDVLILTAVQKVTARKVCKNLLLPAAAIPNLSKKFPVRTAYKNRMVLSVHKVQADLDHIHGLAVGSGDCRVPPSVR